MKIIMLSWEYPPKSVGGLAQHVYDLSSALAEVGEDLHLVTVGGPDSLPFEIINRVKVYRVCPYQISSLDFVHWVTQLNVALMERAVSIMNEEGGFDLIHSHDWLSAYAARALKHIYKIPLVSTIHATEHGRNYGLHNNLQKHISDVEWWLIFESWRIICCSQYMKKELRQVFQVPADKIRVIPNGVNLSGFQVKDSPFNGENQTFPNEKVILFVGRLVREKGVQVLIDAIPQILRKHPRTTFVIAGKGPYESALRTQANMRGVTEHIHFAGYVNDEQRRTLYNIASVAVVPSLYEPFGIVALEAMAAQAPLVVADTGGLGEIVTHGVDGLKAYPGNSHSLADMILRILDDPILAVSLKQKAYHKAQTEYNWLEIAKQTRGVYREITGSEKGAMRSGGERRSNILDNLSRLFVRTS